MPQTHFWTYFWIIVGVVAAIVILERWRKRVDESAYNRGVNAILMDLHKQGMMKLPVKTGYEKPQAKAGYTLVRTDELFRLTNGHGLYEHSRN